MWARDKANGRGIMVYSNDDKFDGDVKNNKLFYKNLLYTINSGMMELNAEKVYIIMQMAQSMMENGQMMIKMELAYFNFLTEIIIKDNFKMENNREKGFM